MHYFSNKDQKIEGKKWQHQQFLFMRSSIIILPCPILAYFGYDV